MFGWELYDYGGIESLLFSDGIEIPRIKSPKDVLVEIYTTSINPIDEYMTGM